MEQKIIFQNYLDTYYPYLSNEQVINILVILQDIHEIGKIGDNYYPNLLCEVDTTIKIRHDPIINIINNTSLIKSTKEVFDSFDKHNKGYLTPKDILNIYKKKLIISETQMTDFISTLYLSKKIDFNIFMNIING